MEEETKRSYMVPIASKLRSITTLGGQVDINNKIL